jgi:outer membrane scaffolding protein for murein synthesis (MipA/OmpV family)
MEFFTRYVWRGLAWSEGPVLQPSVTVGSGPFEATGWANFGLDRRDGTSLNEADLFLSYQTNAGNLGVETSLQFFAYPNQADSPATGEAVVSLHYPVGPFTTYVSHAADFVHYRGAHYTEIGLCYSYEMDTRTSLDVSVGVSVGSRKFNDVYVGVGKAAWNAATLQMALEHELLPGWNLCTSLSLTELLDSDLRASGADRRLAVIGFSMCTSF